MFYQFHQAVHICGKDYRVGEHDVSEKVEYDPYFIKLVGLGLVARVDANKVITAEALVDRQRRLHEELLKRSAFTRAVKMVRAPVAPPRPEPVKSVELPVEPVVEVAEQVAAPVEKPEEEQAEKAEKKKNKKG